MSAKNKQQPTTPPLPAASCSAFRPKDQQWLQEMCELVKAKLPDTHAFVVFAFPVHTTDRMYYASNAERLDAIAALREWLAYADKIDTWMKHDDGPPPKVPQHTPSALERETMLRAALVEFVRVENNFGHTGQHRSEECADCKRVKAANEALSHGYLRSPNARTERPGPQ